MKILFDACFSRTLKRLVDRNHEAVWTQDTEFHGSEDKNLLEKAAAEGFEVFITVDQNIPYQQNLKDFRIAIINILTLSNAAPRLKSIITKLNEVLRTIKTGDCVILKTGNTKKWSGGDKTPDCHREENKIYAKTSRRLLS